MSMYRKKPVVIEAMCLDGQTSQVAAWLNDNGCAFRAKTHPTDATKDELTILTLEGDMRAEPGDWIIKGTRGEFYPCKPDAFADTFEPVEA